MEKMLKKILVFTEYEKHNQKGFTFFSQLISITLILMTLPLLIYLIKAIPYSTAYEELSAHHFFYYLRDELTQAKDYTVEEEIIKLEMEGNRVATIEKYGTLIRRRVNNEGHEIYLRDLRDVKFVKLDYGVHVKLTMLQGEHYEKDIIFYD